MSRSNGYLAAHEAVLGTAVIDSDSPSLLVGGLRVTAVTEVTALDAHPLYSVARLAALVGVALGGKLDSPYSATAVTSVTSPDSAAEMVHIRAAKADRDDAVRFMDGQTRACQVTAPRLPAVTSGGLAVTRPEVEATYTLIADRLALDEALPHLLAAPALGLDTETTGLDPHGDRLRLVQLATRERVYMVDAFHVDPRLVGEVLGRCPRLVAHNAIFDGRFLTAAGVEGGQWFDTMLASQVLSGGDRGARHNLADTCARLLGVVLDKRERRSDWSGSLSAEQLAYAARDAAVLLPLADALDNRLAAVGLQRAVDLEMRALPAVAWMEHAGVGFDADAWRALADAALGERLALEAELNALALELLGQDTLLGRETCIKWSAPQQVLDALRALGLELANTDEQTLGGLTNAHPIVPVLLCYRDAGKREGTYGLKFLANVHSGTSRIHAGWAQIGAASGRMACRTPNLQNVPRQKAYRACFRAPEGRVLVKADYSQIELRIAAELANEPRMLEAYARGDDLHALTARLVLGQEPTKEARQAAKALNFGLLYGMGAERLQAQAATQYGVQWSPSEAARFRDAFFRAYPGLRAWHRGIGEGAETRTRSGRRRLLQGTDARFTNRVNTPVQGTGADGVKAALGLLWERRGRAPGVVPVLAEHDELVVEAPAEHADEAAEHLRGCMRDGMAEFLDRVPVVVDVQIAETWAG